MTGELLQKIRLAMRLDIEPFAKLMGVKSISIARWENYGGPLTLRPDSAEAIVGLLKKIGYISI